MYSVSKNKLQMLYGLLMQFKNNHPFLFWYCIGGTIFLCNPPILYFIAWFLFWGVVFFVVAFIGEFFFGILYGISAILDDFPGVELLLAFMAGAELLEIGVMWYVAFFYVAMTSIAAFFIRNPIYANILFQIVWCGLIAYVWIGVIDSTWHLTVYNYYHCSR